MKTEFIKGKWDERVTIKEQRANAKLNVVAPKLLKCCVDALEDWHSKPSNFNKKEPMYLQEMRDAIKEATE